MIAQQLAPIYMRTSWSLLVLPHQFFRLNMTIRKFRFAAAAVQRKGDFPAESGTAVTPTPGRRLGQCSKLH